MHTCVCCNLSVPNHGERYGSFGYYVPRRCNACLGKSCRYAVVRTKQKGCRLMYYYGIGRCRCLDADKPSGDLITCTTLRDAWKPNRAVERKISTQEEETVWPCDFISKAVVLPPLLFPRPDGPTCLAVGISHVISLQKSSTSVFYIHCLRTDTSQQPTSTCMLRSRSTYR